MSVLFLEFVIMNASTLRGLTSAPVWMVTFMNHHEPVVLKVSFLYLIFRHLLVKMQTHPLCHTLSISAT